MPNKGFVKTTPLQDHLTQFGTFPKVTLHIKPIDPKRKAVELTTFTEYNFESSVLVPISTFTFKLVNPTLDGSLLDFIRDGDIATLKANGTIICTGIIDTVNISTDFDNGEMVSIQGRNLLGQLEDQNAVNDIDDPIWASNLSIEAAINKLILSTRINYYRIQDPPSTPPGGLLFATEPGESKLSALMRFIEPVNCITWMDSDGTIVIGKPDMGAKPIGSFIMDRANRRSNCLSIQANYSSTQIPNVVVPVWTGQETVQSRVAKENAIYNNANGPKRLLGFQHRVPRSVVVSTPQGADAQSLSQVNDLRLVGASNILQAYALREIGRGNVNEIGVQVNIKGHYNDDLEPIEIDTTYNITYPRASLSEKMYLHTVTYSMNAREGQRTSLSFCRLGCIVANTAVLSKKSASKKTQTPGARSQ